MYNNKQIRDKSAKKEYTNQRVKIICFFLRIKSIPYLVHMRLVSRYRFLWQQRVNVLTVSLLPFFHIILFPLLKHKDNSSQNHLRNINTKGLYKHCFHLIPNCGLFFSTTKSHRMIIFKTF